MRTMYLPLRRNRLAFCLVCSRSNIVKIQFKSSSLHSTQVPPPRNRYPECWCVCFQMRFSYLTQHTNTSASYIQNCFMNLKYVYM